ncbi:hypothetical protein CHS0354_001480 [Potamilus streckersoni]|uniref:Methyltransferase FkbM domain-containing protein n=1 Tax=Potamilus streckersoni TaxID=2493646 RepID=A0AAE0W8L4_9BIVA|nr:hypothetical protein CHS0354_001480 [Potamilus streckersoni]
MNYKCTPKSLQSCRCLVLLTVLTLLLLIYVLKGPIWGISEFVADAFIVYNTKTNSPNNSSQVVTDVNSQNMNIPNNSSQQGATVMISQEMKNLLNSSQQLVKDVNRKKNKSRQRKVRPQVPANVQSQKMNRLKTFLQTGVAEDDPNLIQLIRTDFVVLPENKPYHLKNPDVHDYSCGQSSAIDNILNQKEKGFYIEAGAFDGESISNTLFFEKVRKWNGLLIEPDPFAFERLKAKNRKALLVNSCLNIKPQPSILEFNRGNEMGRVWVDEEDKNWVKEMKMRVDVMEVPCFSLYSIVLAVNQTTIDYFSLDVEGRELSVLQSIPFDKVHIDTFTVEYLNGNDNNYYKDIKSFMEKNGYQHVKDLPGYSTCVARDSIFKKI